MRTSKKLLSLFLAVVMVVTTCSVGFTAFAKDNSKSIWNTDAEASDAFDALNSLASDYLPGLLMGIGIIGNPICDNYAKNNPDTAKQLYAKYAEANNKSVSDLTVAEKREAVKDAAAEEASLSDALSALQPMLLPLLNKAAGSIAGGKVFVSDQQGFADKYYPGTDASRFDYLKTDGQLSYFEIVSLCDTYKNSDLLSSDEQQMLSDWFDTLFPLSKLATSTTDRILAYGQKFNDESEFGQPYTEAAKYYFDVFDFEVAAEDVDFIQGLCDAYNNQLREFGISADDITINGIGDILFYYYGVGQNVITSYRYYNLIKKAGATVDFHGEADPLDLGLPFELDITEELTPSNLFDILNENYIVALNESGELEDLVIEDVSQLLALSYFEDPEYEFEEDELKAILAENEQYYYRSYLNEILPTHYNDALKGIAIEEGAVSSAAQFDTLLAATLPNGTTGIDSSIFSADDIKSLGLAVEATNVDGQTAAAADAYFGEGTLDVNQVNLNYTITLPAVLKDTAVAEYLRLITGHYASNDYKQDFRATLLSPSANCFELADESGALVAGPDGLPVIKDSCPPDLEGLSEFLADAEQYSYSKLLTDLTGIQGSVKDSKSHLTFVIDIIGYLNSKSTDVTSASLTDEQKALISNTADFTNHIGTVVLNDILNKVVLGVLQLELLGQTAEQMVNNLLTTKVDLTVALEDVWSRLMDSPIATIVELLPVVVVALDELVIPFLAHAPTDQPPGELYGLLSDSLLQGLIADGGSYIGITTLSWDLNKLLPNLMHWLLEGYDAEGIEYWEAKTVEVRDNDGEGNFIDKRIKATDIDGSDIKYYTAEDQDGNRLVREDVDGTATYTYMGKTSDDLAAVLAGHEDAVFTLYMTYESDVPNLTGIYIADKLLRGAEVSDLSRIIGKALKNETIGNILGEVITEIAVLFTAAVDEFVSTPAYVDAPKYDISGKVVGRGLNNLFVAIPQLFDIMENLAADKYGVAENAWTYCYDGKIVEKTFDTNEGQVTSTVNTDLEQFKSFAISDDANRSIDIFDCFAGIFVEDWLNAILSLVNNVVSTDNSISGSLPIVSGLLNALGGLGEDSIITDVINGIFQIEREDELSFTFEKRANGLTGLSENHAYFLIANIDTLIDVIMGLVNNIKNGASISGNALIGNTKNASSKAPTIKNAKANSKTYTDKELSNASDLIKNLDKLVSSLLSDSTLNDFSLNSTTNILAGVISFFSNYLGTDCYTELGRLLDKYVYYITGKDTHTADKKHNVDAKKVYTNDSMTGLMVETFLLIEDIVETLFSDFSTTHTTASGEKASYNLIVEAVEGIISPDAICVRLDGYDKVAKQLTKYNCWHNAAAKTSRGDYKISLDWGIKDGSKDDFFKAFAASFRLVSSILGVILVDTGWYSSVVMPILKALCDKNGVKVDTAKQFAKLTNGYHDEALLGLMKPIGGWLDKLLSAPVTTIIKSVQGIAGILDDKSSPSIASIVKGAITPLTKEIKGLASIFTIESDKLLATSPTLADLLTDSNKGIVATLDKYSNTKNIKIKGYALSGANIIPIVNSLLSNTGISLKQISWSKLANAKSPAAALVYVLDYIIETILDNDNLTALAQLINNDIVTMIIEALKSGNITSSDLLGLINKVLEATDTPTLAYWTFVQYLQEITESFAYPVGITKSMADAGVTQLDTAVNSVLKLLGSLGVDLGGTDLQGILTKNLFKNDILTKLATALYGALDGLDPTIKSALAGLGIVTSTKDVAKLLTDTSYGKTFTSAANKIKAQKSWSNVKNVNWGFKDGSAKAQQGFINALAAILRPLSGVLSVFLNEGSLELNDVVYKLITSIEVKKTTTYLSISDGDVPINVKVTYSMKNGVFTAKFREDSKNRSKSKDSTLKLDLKSLKKTLSDVKIEGTNGYNSAIIPLLEVLGCENVKTYKQYQSDAAKAKDNILLDILNPLLGGSSSSFLNKLCANPVSELTKLLPNLAMYFDAHGLSQLISNLLAPVTNILYSAADTLKLDALLEDVLGMPLGDFVGNLLGLDEGTLNIQLSDLTTLNIEDIVIPVVNMVLSGLDNPYLSKLNIKNIDLNALISLGTKSTYTSKATGADGKFLTGKILKNVDQGKVLVAVLRYVATILVDNATTLKNLICNIDAVKKNDLIKSIVQSVFDTIATATPDQIVAAVFYFLAGEPSNAFWDYSAYQTGKFDFSYPEGIDTDFLKNLPPMLDGLIGGLIDLNETISKALYKDEIVSKLATALYGAIEGVKVGNGTLTDLLAQTDIDFSTSNVANLLVDEAYGQSFASAAATIKAAGSWKNVKAESLKWGVTDRDSFMHALVAVLRPIYGVLDVLLNSASLGIFNIVRIPGSNGYTAAIVPLLEAFSCYNVKTQYQYRQDIAKEYDAILLDIINPIWDKVEDILAAPLQTVAAMIPNLGLFIGNDGLCQILDNLLTPVSALLDAVKPVVDLNDLVNALLPALGVDLNSLLGKIGVKNFKLDLYDINETLKPILGGDAIISLVNNVLGMIKIKGTPLGIKLNDVNWLQLASHGETIVSYSQAATYGPRIFVKGDSSETLIAVLRYLIVTINTGDNFNNISSLIGGLIGGADDTISGVVSQVLEKLQGDTDEVIAALVDLLQVLGG